MARAISRREFVRATAAGTALGSLTAMLASGAERAERPNIVFIITDQQRLDSIAAYGNPVVSTPNLDRLCREGTRLNGAYLAAYPCSPSRGSILTGQYPHRHGVIFNNLNLDPQTPTLATALREVGYDTCWMGKWHLASGKIVERDEHGKPIGVGKAPDPPTQPPLAGFTDWVSPHSDYVEYLRKHGLEEPIPGEKVRGGHHTVIRDNYSVIPEEHFISAFLRKKAIDYLKKRKGSGKPFFLGVSFPGPHRPMTPPKPWHKMYDPDKMPLPPNNHDELRNKPEITQRQASFYMHGKTGEQLKALHKRTVFKGEFWDLFDRGEFGEREFKEVIANYYGFVSYIDKQVGMILNELEQQGLAQNTIVVFTTDHGDLTASHGMIFKNLTMYDELMRVPFIMRWPGRVPADAEADALVSSVDYMPTLLDMAGVAVPATVQGRSFKEVAEGKQKRHRQVTISAITPLNHQIRMIRSGHMKFALNWKPRQIDELYDLEKDPHELNNLAADASYDKIREEMRGQALAAMRETGDPWLAEASERSRYKPFKPAGINFDFDAPPQAWCWHSFRGISNLAVKDGCLCGEIACPGFMVCRLHEALRADAYSALEIRMKVSAGDRAQFYWTTEEEPNFEEKKSLAFKLAPGVEFHTYRLELGRNPRWKGKRVNAIRLNPVRVQGVRAEFEIDSMRGLP